MKNQLLLALLLVFSASAFGQYSRSIHTTINSNSRHAVILERNAQTEIVSLRKSYTNTLVITLISIDEFGNTSNYRTSSYSPFDVFGLQLSGAGVNSAGEITLTVLGESGSQSLVRFITIDPVSGAVSNFYELPGSYKKGYTRTQAKGDSLITYLAKYGASGIDRVATSMTNPSNNSITVADPTLTSNSYNMTDRSMDLFIDGNDEYVGLKEHLIKRSGSGVFQNLALSNLAFSSQNIVKNSQGEIVIFRANTYTTVSPSFAIVASGTYAGGNTLGLGNEEISALNNGGYRIWNYASQNKKQIDLDLNFNLVSELTNEFIPLFSAKIGSKVYVLGSRQDYLSSIGVAGEGFTNNAGSLTIVCDDLASAPRPLIDYNQELAHHKFRFQTNHCGMSFRNPTGEAGFRYLLDSVERSLIFASRLNIGAIGPNGDTLFFAGTSSMTAVPGPYTNGADYGFEEMDKYNRGYFVTRAMIESHIFDIGQNNPNYVIPFAIREWPAHGDVSKGQAANLAGFVDLDGNNQYNPENGDYPAIYGDACLLNIFHQSPYANATTSIETHQYYFMFDCLNDEDLENTIFTRTDNFARTQNLVDLYAGNYVDFDIGNFADDYIGSNVELGIVYGYNADMNDETNGGNAGFGTKIPAMGMMTLQGVKMNNTGVDRPFGVGPGESINGIGYGDGIPDNEYLTLESSVYYQSTAGVGNSYQMMTGTNADGSPQLANGIAVRHTFFGASDPLFYTSGGIDHGNNYYEFTAQTPAGDRRMIGSSGPADIAQQDTLTLYTAFVFGMDSTVTNIEASLTPMFDRSAIIRDMFRTNTTPCGGNFKTYVSESTLSLTEPELHEILMYPNPASMSFKLKGIAGQAHIQIIDLNGRIVAEETGFTDGQEISIQELDTAVYLVSVEDEKGKQVIRLVKR